MQSTLAFISHRSTQKSFVKKIVDIVKRDNCIVDEFDFYPATKTMDVFTTDYYSIFYR